MCQIVQSVERWPHSVEIRGKQRPVPPLCLLLEMKSKQFLAISLNLRDKTRAADHCSTGHSGRSYVSAASAAPTRTNSASHTTARSQCLATTDIFSKLMLSVFLVELRILTL
ncbi:hypothetical protein RRG08_060856 [Elysia crispata]|uniref:Uncharacterized protein n=1 Tax=Elysia crispata TaxID=231223 RepID=A0AAE1DF83_9GAST|nr:hypothetical protein RRG08_060856 [Elysia crispata]